MVLIENAQIRYALGPSKKKRIYDDQITGPYIICGIGGRCYLAADGLKFCTQCKVRRALSEFWRRPNAQIPEMRYSRICRNCKNERYKTYKIEHLEQWQARIKKQNEKRRLNVDRSADQRFRRYGITKEKYMEMLNIQNRSCAICNETAKNDHGFHIDHNHITGNVRGLLCGKCNMALGMLQEREDLFLSAVRYLRERK